jgi:hypothetical protein
MLGEMACGVHRRATERSRSWRGRGRCGRMARTTVREMERKYEAADGVELPGWAGLVGVESLVGPDE